MYASLSKRARQASALLQSLLVRRRGKASKKLSFAETLTKLEVSPSWPSKTLNHQEMDPQCLVDAMESLDSDPELLYAANVFTESAKHCLDGFAFAIQHPYIILKGIDGSQLSRPYITYEALHALVRPSQAYEEQLTIQEAAERYVEVWMGWRALAAVDDQQGLRLSSVAKFMANTKGRVGGNNL